MTILIKFPHKMSEVYKEWFMYRRSFQDTSDENCYEVGIEITFKPQVF